MSNLTNQIEANPEIIPATTPIAVTNKVALATVGNSSNADTLPLDQNPAAIYLATLRPNGRRAMHYALDTMAHYVATGEWPTAKGKASKGKKAKKDTSPNNTNSSESGNAKATTIPDALTLPWHTLRYQHTSALMAALREHYKPATANLMLSALRGVLSQAENLGLMTAEEYRRAVKIKSVKNHTLPKGRQLAGDELAALLEVCAVAAEDEDSIAGVRDAAMIAVLYNAGLRRSEVIKLDLKDFNAAESSLTIRGGKGGKDRVTYLADTAIELVNKWLTVRQESLQAVELAKGKNTDKAVSCLFCPISKAGRVQPRRLTDQAVLYILQKRGKEAGLEQAFSPHDFRRTFISDLLDAGADIATVQKLAGHANVTTTARYDRRGEDTKRKAAQLLKLPKANKKGQL